MYFEASALNQTAIIRDRTKRLNGHSIPHQLRIGGRKLFIGDPIRESQPPILSENSKSFGEGLRRIWHMAKCFLADNSIHGRIRKRNAHKFPSTTRASS